jgi:plastocyanin
MLLLAVAFGVFIIYLAFQELGDKAEVTESEGSEVSSPGGARTVVVKMRDVQFEPESVSIRAGQTVRWVNQDQTDHTVVKVSGPSEDFDSGDIAGGDSYDQSFADKGIVEYMCQIHPGAMRGEVKILGD